MTAIARSFSTHRSAQTAVAVAFCVLAAAMAGCGRDRPPVDPGRVLTVENRVSQAVLVQIDVSSQTDGATSVFAVRPCAGSLSLTFGKEIALVPEMDRWQSMLFVDPSGQFDRALAAWEGDLATVPGTFPNLTTVVWARGDIPIETLPKWLTVTGSGAALSAVSTPAASACQSLDASILHP